MQPNHGRWRCHAFAIEGIAMPAIGHRRWAMAEGYIPSESSFSDPTLVSHETACILNAGDRDAHVAITIYFADREPAGPFRTQSRLAERCICASTTSTTRNQFRAIRLCFDIRIRRANRRPAHAPRFTPCRGRPLVDGGLRGGLTASQPTADAEPFALRNVGRREWVPAGAVSK